MAKVLFCFVLLEVYPRHAGEVIVHGEGLHSRSVFILSLCKYNTLGTVPKNRIVNSSSLRVTTKGYGVNIAYDDIFKLNFVKNFGL